MNRTYLAKYIDPKDILRTKAALSATVHVKDSAKKTTPVYSNVGDEEVQDYAFHNTGRFLQAATQKNYLTKIGMSGGPDYSFIPSNIGFESWLSEIDLVLPRSRHFLNNLIFTFYKQDGLVGNTIDLHTQITYSDFALTNIDEHVTAEYETILDNIDFRNKLYLMMLDYYLYGETFVVGEWDSHNYCWSDIHLRPPHCFTLRDESYQADEVPVANPELRIMYHRDMYHEWIGKQTTNVTTDIYFSGLMQFGATDVHEIDPFYVFMVRDIPSGACIRGHSCVTRALSWLLYARVLINANYRIARDRLKYPDVVEVGLPQYEWYGFATPQRIQDVMRQVQFASSDPNAFLVTPGDVKFNLATEKLRLLPLAAELEHCRKMISLALWSGVDEMAEKRAFSYASEFIHNRIREYRYAVHRNKFKKVLLSNVLLPIAVARGYQRVKQASVGTEKSPTVHIARNETEIANDPDILMLPNIEDTDKIFVPSHREAFEKRYDQRRTSLQTYLHSKRSAIKGKVTTSLLKESIKQSLKEQEPITKQCSSLVKTASSEPKIAALVEYELPTINWLDKIQLQDDTSKLNILLDVFKSGKGPIVLPTIYELIGLDFDEILERSEKYEGKKWTDPSHAALYNRDFDQYDRKISEKAKRERPVPNKELQGPQKPQQPPMGGGLTPGSSGPGIPGGATGLSPIPRSPGGTTPGPGVPPPGGAPDVGGVGEPELDMPEPPPTAP